MSYYCIQSGWILTKRRCIVCIQTIQLSYWRMWVLFDYNRNIVCCRSAKRFRVRFSDFYRLVFFALPPFCLFDHHNTIFWEFCFSRSAFFGVCFISILFCLFRLFLFRFLLLYESEKKTLFYVVTSRFLSFFPFLVRLWFPLETKQQFCSVFSNLVCINGNEKCSKCTYNKQRKKHTKTYEKKNSITKEPFYSDFFFLFCLFLGLFPSLKHNKQIDFFFFFYLFLVWCIKYLSISFCIRCRYKHNRK